jgi:hypothetical protein
MTAIKMVLYVVSAVFMLTIILVFVPWDALNAFMGFFGPAMFPDVPIVQYTVKTFFVVWFWIGVLLWVAVRRPEQHQAVLLILGAMCASAAVFCLALGWIYGVPPFFYWDAVSCAVIAALILVYRAGVLRAQG